MNQFIELTNQDGSKFSVNVSYIFYLKPREGNQCHVYLSTGCTVNSNADYLVSESYDEVKELISAVK